MSRVVKYFVISFVSLILVYYSTAWAVLRCSHDENAPNEGVAISITEAVSSEEASLECLGSDGYTESLAGPPSSAEIDALASLGTSSLTDGLGFASLAADGLRDAWLSAVFRNQFTAIFPIYPPPYLFLSVLRI